MLLYCKKCNDWKKEENFNLNYSNKECKQCGNKRRRLSRKGLLPKSDAYNAATDKGITILHIMQIENEIKHMEVAGENHLNTGIFTVDLETQRKALAILKERLNNVRG